MGKNTAQSNQWVDKCYPDSTPLGQMVAKCIADFNSVCTDTDDVERSGRESSAVVLENIAKVHKMVLADRKLKLLEIADTLKI